MPLDRLLARIIKDADSAGKAEVEEARREAERIRAEGRERAAGAARAVREEIMGRAEAERVSIMGERLARSRAAYLTRQEELYEEIFADALQEAESLPEEPYRAWLKRTVLAGASGEGEEEVLAAPYDRRLLESGLLEEINRDLRGRGNGKALRLSPETATFARGVVLKGDRVENNLSLETVLRQVRAEHEVELLDIVFGESRIKGIQPGSPGGRP
jgi:vacuolar-type H+-ATPase subunit E/Vma4